MKKHTLTLCTILSATALTVASCSAPEEDSDAQNSSESTAAGSHEHDHDHEGHSHDGMEAKEGQTEVAELPTRIVFSHAGGLTTYDAQSGDILDEEKMDAFLRLNDAGNDRHVMVTKGDKFLTYDTGRITKAHGDHNHYYTADPKLGDDTIKAPHAGHVVHHDGYTALFSDGDGVAQIYKTEDIGSKDAKPVNTVETGEGHHGVAVPMKDGSVVITKGTEDERHTIQHLDKDGKVLEETTECPGVHGESAAENGKLFFGCEDGPVVFDGSKFHKIDVSDYAGAGGYQRSGNSAGSEKSNVILADNKTEKDAESEHPTSVALIDTENYSAKKVDLDGSYWFRSLARGPMGEALVLTTDGKLNVIDPDSGEITKKIDAISTWTENEEWQQPGPILKAANGYAYITDAQKKELVIIDLLRGKETKRYELDFKPVEMAVL
ncbi:hypothetical protein GWO53_02675 [Corynebacterium macginleyi]|uniref:Secreted protein n=1 Tax=Corynebacterium macginleyi TaxID=38290 RepID=A0A3M0GPP2_9CORY|nr:hypothetical protein [Corynebacterium macginleyi]MBK4139426.1 hypothetical protein [Corynebacterium macginleyi]MBK4151106.1 hypothetical protein [Corynebacterium macginleyi]MBK4157334.1 hypothetical protein [Corynebacterium macginleyi]MBK4165655.1 hypothetical protein [Corynebacterium macginleyi]MBK4167373.1 hypothetical protein [Corynebacterium macginleyi]